MDKVINVVRPGNPMPSLSGRTNTYKEDIYEMQKSNGSVYRLFKSQYETERKKMMSGRQELYKHNKYSNLYKGHYNYWEFIRYLAKNGRVGGFQCIKSKENELKIDYFNATGEELEENQYNPDLNPDTWGNAMRVFFPELNGLSIEEINEMLPGDVVVKKWENTNELVISRMSYVLELLSMGFRHGKNHSIEKIEEHVKKFVNSD